MRLLMENVVHKTKFLSLTLSFTVILFSRTIVHCPYLVAILNLNFFNKFINSVQYDIVKM